MFRMDSGPYQCSAGLKHGWVRTTTITKLYQSRSAVLLSFPRTFVGRHCYTIIVSLIKKKRTMPNELHCHIQSRLSLFWDWMLGKGDGE